MPRFAGPKVEITRNERFFKEIADFYYLLRMSMTRFAFPSERGMPP